jgi:restriction system protein
VKLKMAENSLFAILLRSPWWISIVIAAIIAAIARASLRDEFVIYGALAGTPFLVIGIVAASRQLRVPSAKRVAVTLDAIGAMPWREFSDKVEEAFRRNGYEVARLSGGGADYAMTKSGRTALLSCRRWKAASSGIEPLRELQTAMKARDAHESIYMTAGDVSDSARRFAKERNIRLLQGAELAQLFRSTGTAKKAAK